MRAVMIMATVAYTLIAVAVFSINRASTACMPPDKRSHDLVEFATALMMAAVWPANAAIIGFAVVTIGSAGRYACVVAAEPR